MGLCKDCAHYIVYDGKQNKCHRYPKPVTKSDGEFCGEFKLDLAKHRRDYNEQRHRKHDDSDGNREP